MMIVQKVREYSAANPKISVPLKIAPNRLGQRETNFAELTQQRVLHLGRFGLRR